MLQYMCSSRTFQVKVKRESLSASVFDQTPACGHKNNWKSVNPSQNTWSTQKRKEKKGKKMNSGNREGAKHREKAKMRQKETEL